MSENSSHNISKTVALVGSPNSGKTTLYNWLTGSHFKTVNYPGATVEYSVGQLHERFNAPIRVVDTPGVYSLFPKSEDEVVTYNVVSGQAPSLGKMDFVLVVIDGTQLARHLSLVSQVKSLGVPFTIIVTMEDLLRSQNITLDIDLLSKEFSSKVILFDGLLGKGLNDIIKCIQRPVEDYTIKALEVWNDVTYDNKNKYYAELVSKILSKNKNVRGQLSSLSATTRKIDKILLHPLWGLVFFISVMTLLFSSVFFFAKPLMEIVDWFFSFLGDGVQSFPVSSLIKDFLSSGVLSGLSSVFVFVPQIFVLFFGIGLMESSGYLARAATIIDKPFSKLGLSGRSFVPMLSGFACAVPAIMATRNINSFRDRLITNFAIPLMTCSARLPVYALLLAILFYGQAAWMPGLVLAIIYIISLILGAIASAILNLVLPKKEKSFLMMELPLYRRPLFKLIFRQAVTRTISYVKRAGPIIFIFSVSIWFLTNFPAVNLESKTARLESSYASQVGKKIEPIFKPMGADWRVGVGLMTAFTAREVFVSSLAVLFNAEETVANIDGAPADQGGSDIQQSLIQKMRSAQFPNGEKIFSIASTIALIVFFMFAMQCMSTFAIFLKEMNSIKLALTQLVLYNVVAYILAVVTFKLLS